jgi:hypothetical protein
MISIILFLGTLSPVKDLRASVCLRELRNAEFTLIVENFASYCLRLTLAPQGIFMILKWGNPDRQPVCHLHTDARSPQRLLCGLIVSLAM